MAQPSFTWTVVSPNHLIRSECDSCARLVAVSARGDLLHILERMHHCAALLKSPPQSVRLSNGGFAAAVRK